LPGDARRIAEPESAWAWPLPRRFFAAADMLPLGEMEAERAAHLFCFLVCVVVAGAGLRTPKNKKA